MRVVCDDNGCFAYLEADDGTLWGADDVAKMRGQIADAVALFKEACDSMDESVSKAEDGRWYMKKMPSFINIDWQMRAIIFMANAR